MKLIFNWPKSIPVDQIDKKFIQGMLDRMAMGYHTYGHMRRTLNRPDSLKCADIRRKHYKKTGNTEALMDEANFLMMEFAVPSHKKAHFRATEAHESPGAIVGDKLVKSKAEFKKEHSVAQREGD